MSEHGQGQKSEQKHTTKNFVEFHNHSPLLTMVVPSAPFLSNACLPIKPSSEVVCKRHLLRHLCQVGNNRTLIRSEAHAVYKIILSSFAALKYKNSADINFVCQCCFASIFVRAAHGTYSGSAPALVSHTNCKNLTVRLVFKHRRSLFRCFYNCRLTFTLHMR